MNPWTKKVVRCWVDLTNTADFQDKIAGGFKVFNSAGFELQLAFGIGPESSGALADISEFALVKALIWLAGNPYLDSAATLLDPALTFAEWSAGVSARAGFERAAHAVIEFAAVDMVFNLNGQDSLQYKLTLHGDTSDDVSDADAFARTTVTVIDAGFEISGPRQAANLVPAGANYDGSGHYTLNGLTTGGGYRWTQGGDDTSVVNGAQTVSVNNDVFWAQGTSVVLTGTANSPVTAVIWYPATLTADETEALLAAAPVNTFAELWVKANDGNYYQCTLVFQGGVPAWNIDQTSGTVSPNSVALNIFNVLWVQAQNGLYYACSLAIQAGVPTWTIDQTSGTTNPT